ncbi:glycosyl transferase [Ophiocordyceps sinensis CO18]|nr:glycosyl transferase [Ophiocordyceps sinensis CO18]
MIDFKDALGIYLAYFFIFSVNIPEECPRVFQSTHHGISSLFGMLLKYRRGVTFGIWDHTILWRESCLNISPAQCELSVPVQSMLLAGIRLASRLAYFHADIVVPCTSLFNPMWETEIGTDRGKLCSGNEFARKIDPIVNGISNMESFTPVDKVRTDTPTVVMLSNVQFIKGIKTAILAADIIVNRYGFHDYKLLVYGAKDRQPSYALEMAKLIVKCDLSDNVILAGFGKPKEVSATALVVTDPDDQSQRYGEIVAPNDPVALARAQVSLLSMVGPWAKFTEDGDTSGVGGLPEDMSAEDVEWLSRRMYDKSDDRRRLGLLSREVVLHSFHGRRYLREHEQMYWVQWHMAKMRADQALGGGTRNAYRFGSLPPLRYKEAAPEEEEVWKETDKEDEAATSEVESDRMTMVDWESQTVQSLDLGTNLGTRLSKLMRPSFINMDKHRSSGLVPYIVPCSLGRSTAASSFSNWAPG